MYITPVPCTLLLGVIVESARALTKHVAGWSIGMRCVAPWRLV